MTEHRSKLDSPAIFCLEIFLISVACSLIGCDKPRPTAETTPNHDEAWWSYPEEIESIVPGEDSLYLVVDKGHQLPADYVPADLVTITPDIIETNKEIQVVSVLLEPLRKLNAKAQADGINLSVISGYRSYQYQEKTYQHWITYNKGDRDAADRVSARPGHSEHQLGTVVDFSTDEINHTIGDAFHRTKACAWLLENAPSFGFSLSYPKGKEHETRYSHEGWHWRFLGFRAVAL
ncbi:MAG: M15 family metallopeptidase [Verrucomicrobiales bacterium]